MEIRGLESQGQDELPTRVSISIPGGLGSLGSLLGGGQSSGSGLDDLFGFTEDSESSPGGVSLSFNFPGGGSLGNVAGRHTGCAENTPGGGRAAA